MGIMLGKVAKVALVQHFLALGNHQPIGIVSFKKLIKPLGLALRVYNLKLSQFGPAGCGKLADIPSPGNHHHMHWRTSIAERPTAGWIVPVIGHSHLGLAAGWDTLHRLLVIRLGKR